jgi:hypothetical protein
MAARSDLRLEVKRAGPIGFPVICAMADYLSPPVCWHGYKTETRDSIAASATSSSLGRWCRRILPPLLVNGEPIGSSV